MFFCAILAFPYTPFFTNFMKNIISSFFSLVILTVLATPAFADIIYVATNGDGSGGTSWATAYKTVGKAIDFAVSGDEIWIKAGTYKEGSQLKMKNDVKIRGGFAGTEASVEERIVGQNETILDGNNTHRVIYNDFPSASPLTAGAVLDSLTIANGKALSTNGGGMYNSYASPTVTNCTFSGNRASSSGAGMYNISSSPIVANCTFSGNTDSYYGGGMYNYYASPTVINCTFSGNVAHSDGGGMFNYSCSPTLTNCTFSGNTASYNGGGMSNYYASPTVTNCTFSGNVASYGGGMHNYLNSSPKITNCILWDNTGGEIYNDGSSPVVSYCVVKGDYTGTGNVSTDPLLASIGNYGGAVETMPVLTGSSARAAGATQAQVPSGVSIPTTDAIGQVRNTTKACTIGAVEYFAVTAVTLSFSGNGATGGTAPSAISGRSGITVTLPGTGTLVKTDYTLAGWNTNATGTGTNYAAGAAYTIDRKSVV